MLVAEEFADPQVRLGRVPDASQHEDEPLALDADEDVLGEAARDPTQFVEEAGIGLLRRAADHDRDAGLGLPADGGDP